MLNNWGYHKLGNYIRKQSIDEMKHAERLLERILFLDGSPTMQPLALSIGADVRSQLRNDLGLELNAVKAYNESITISMNAGDNTSRELFERLLHDEEGHVDFLEAQLTLIEQVGYERYLSQHMGGADHE